MVILFASDKGGVGKSTTAANMAVMMSMHRNFKMPMHQADAMEGGVMPS
ncbi:P-loop NTPase [Pseudomonas californiensis]|nr:P-loop NTPase [Pseudomonas californiensis]